MIVNSNRGCPISELWLENMLPAISPDAVALIYARKMQMQWKTSIEARD